MDTQELLAAMNEINILTKTFSYNFVVANDEISTVNKKPPFFIIQNTGNADTPGYHWVMWLKINHSTTLTYFDSFAKSPQFYELNLPFNTKTKIQRNKYEIQHSESNLCGNYCLYVMYNILEKRKFEDIILDFSPSTLRNNDRIVSNFYDNLSFKISYNNAKKCQTSCLRHVYT